MSTRKKWRIKLYPMFEHYSKQSKKAAYEEVEEWRRGYANGVLAVHEVDIEVDEGDGHGWVLYERCIFPERKETD